MLVYAEKCNTFFAFSNVPRREDQLLEMVTCASRPALELDDVN